jgi:hypothetical protein
MKAQFLYSTIFEKEEDCKNNPFVFEKHSLGPRRDDYPDLKCEGSLFKKKSESNELKERYFNFTEHKIIQFKVIFTISDS